MRDHIRGEIAASGPITFARFMELALYGEDGYYDQPPIGAGGDFVTAPHVHPVFATLLARAMRQLHVALGAPDPLRIVEMGAGDGTLARGLLDELADIPLAYTVLDVSPGARQALRAIPGLDGVGAELGEPFDLLIANELLDNLPFRLLRAGEEIGIGVNAGGDLEQVSIGTGAGLAALSREGAEVVPTGALALVDTIADVIGESRAYALFIDYGNDGGAGGPVHGYAAHHVVEDLLMAPGRTDITAGVDFGLLSEHAGRRGLVAFSTVTQREALLALGFDTWFEEQLETQRTLLNAGQGVAAVKTWSDRSRASLLGDPAGLGRFRWLLLATLGLPEPPWLLDAHAP